MRRAPSCNCSTSAPAVVRWRTCVSSSSGSTRTGWCSIPSAGVDPSILRLEGLVGHFSTYSFVAVTLAGDYNRNGVVDAADYTVWRNTLGQIGPRPRRRR